MDKLLIIIGIRKLTNLTHKHLSHSVKTKRKSIAQRQNNLELICMIDQLRNLIFLYALLIKQRLY